MTDGNAAVPAKRGLPSQERRSPKRRRGYPAARLQKWRSRDQHPVWEDLCKQVWPSVRTPKVDCYGCGPDRRQFGSAGAKLMAGRIADLEAEISKPQPKG
jgi:hypothetical protein